MNEIVLNSKGFEQEINNFESSKNKIKAIFERERRNMNVLNNGHSWVGKAGETMYRKQEMFQKNFEPVIEALETFIRYMKASLERQKQREEETIKDIETNDENLDVNS